MKIFNKYINFSKLLTFCLVLAFFAILIFDAYIVMRLIAMIENGINLMYATVIGTIISVISTFGSGVIMLGVKAYIDKSAKENSAGYDSRTNTTAEERMAVMKFNMNDGGNI